MNKRSQKRIQKSTSRQSNTDAVNDKSSDEVLHDCPTAAPRDAHSFDKFIEV
jgi:hypothetical protein